MEPILDEDIAEHRLQNNELTFGRDCYNASLTFILLNLSYANIELRHYSDAVDCLNECEILAEDKVPDVYFRRSQARTYNKYSNDYELELAMKDIIKARQLDKENVIYDEHYKKLVDLIDMNRDKKLQRIKSKIIL